MGWVRLLMERGADLNRLRNASSLTALDLLLRVTPALSLSQGQAHRRSLTQSQGQGQVLSFHDVVKPYLDQNQGRGAPGAGTGRRGSASGLSLRPRAGRYYKLKGYTYMSCYFTRQSIPPPLIRRQLIDHIHS